MGKPALVSRESLLTNPNKVEFAYDSINDAFPTVEPGMEPFGVMCVFQIKHPKRRSKGGLLLTEDTRSTEYYNTQVGKVVRIGPLCFRSAVKVPGKADELVPWAEGPWFKIGDFVRLPKYGGDRFTVPHAYEDFEEDPATGRKEKVTVKDEIVFAIFKSSDVLAKITANPLTIKAFLD